MCGGGGDPHGEKDGYPLYRCHGCGVIFLFPVPSASELEQLYAEDWAVANAWCESPDDDFAPKKRFLRGFRWTRKARKLRSLCEGGALLEIGCGSGDYLAAARKAGFTKILALEPSRQEAAYARRRGFDVRDGVFEEADFEGQQFDAIVARHVIEHVADPVHVLVKAGSLLAPGGLLLLETPCSSHPKAVKRGLAWKAISPPWHLNVFDEHSLEVLFHRAGIEPVAIRRHFRRPDMSGLGRKATIPQQ